MLSLSLIPQPSHASGTKVYQMQSTCTEQKEQIPGPHQGQQHLLVMMLYYQKSLSVTHCMNSHVKKGFYCRNLHKKLSRTTHKSKANSLSTFWAHFSTTGAWQLPNQSAAIYYLALKEIPKNIPVTLILGAGCHPSFVHQNWNCVIWSKKGMFTCDKM